MIKKGFLRANTYLQIDQIASLGKKNFIDYYFKDGYLIMEKTNNWKEVIAIADKLLDWKIESYMDDLTGSLVIKKSAANSIQTHKNQTYNNIIFIIGRARYSCFSSLV